MNNNIQVRHEGDTRATPRRVSRQASKLDTIRTLGRLAILTIIVSALFRPLLVRSRADGGRPRRRCSHRRCIERCASSLRSSRVMRLEEQGLRPMSGRVNQQHPTSSQSSVMNQRWAPTVASLAPRHALPPKRALSRGRTVVLVSICIVTCDCAVPSFISSSLRYLAGSGGIPTVVKYGADCPFDDCPLQICY